MHLSLLCRLQQDRPHRPCSGGCDGHGTGRPCERPCECGCHGEAATLAAAAVLAALGEGSPRGRRRALLGRPPLDWLDCRGRAIMWHPDGDCSGCEDCRPGHACHVFGIRDSCTAEEYWHAGEPGDD